MIFRGALLLLCYQPTRVVGYNTITLPEGQQYTLIAIPFDDIGTTEGYTLDDLFAGKSKDIFHAAPGFANADQIQIWMGTDYTTVYLNQNTLTTGINPQKNGHWCLSGSRPDATWAAQNGGVCIKKFPAGTSFWIKRFVATTVNKGSATEMAEALPAKTIAVSGQVVVKQDGKAGYVINAGATDKTCGYTLIAAGFSAGFAPNPDIAVSPADPSKQIDWEEMGCFAAAGFANADQLQFWNGKDYVLLYLNKNTLTTGINPQKNGHWCLSGSRPDATWAAQNGGPCIKTFDPTVGFWYKRAVGQPSFTFYIDQPYSL